MNEKEKKVKCPKKKKILYAVNIAMIILIFCTAMFRWHAYGIIPVIFNYTLIQIAFTIFSLIVYYLSIIADAISGKHVGQTSDDLLENKSRF